jgi:hypothetical protein
MPAFPLSRRLLNLVWNLNITIWRVVLLAICLLSAGPANFKAFAAEIYVKSKLPLKGSDRGAGSCQLSLSGEIVKGDAEKLAEIYRQLEPPLMEGNPYWGQGGDGFDMCLDSPGGLLSEGILIARYLREKGISTYLPAGSECVSACAIAFFGGSIFADIRFDIYVMNARAKLGLHAPSLTLNADLTTLPVEVMRSAIDVSYKSAVADIREISETLVAPENGKSSLSPELFIEMLSTPPDQIFWIETVNHAGLYDIPIATQLSSLPLSQETLLRGCDNMLNWAESLSAGNYDQSSFVRTNVNISQIRDPRTRRNEEAWQFEEISSWGGGLRNSSCTFFLTKGSGQISTESLRAEVYNSRVDSSKFYETLQPWMFLSAETKLGEISGQ